MLTKDYASGRSDWTVLSSGDKQFRHDGLVVKPILVLLDKKRRRLFITERAISSDSREPSEIDRVSARITAFVVIPALRKSLPRRVAVSLYLSYPGNTQREIDSRLSQTAKMIREHRQYQSRRFHFAPARKGTEAMPGQALAYALSGMRNITPSRWDRSHG